MSCGSDRTVDACQVLRNRPNRLRPPRPLLGAVGLVGLELREALERRSIVLPKAVGVAVHREGDRPVAGQALRRLGVDAGAGQVADEAVPEGV